MQLQLAEVRLAQNVFQGNRRTRVYGSYPKSYPKYNQKLICCPSPISIHPEASISSLSYTSTARHLYPSHVLYQYNQRLRPTSFSSTSLILMHLETSVLPKSCTNTITDFYLTQGLYQSTQPET